jgi:hypothetical protein
MVEMPLAESGFTAPKLILLRSPYREFFGPLLRHVREQVAAHPHRYVAVVVPELVDRRWYELILRSHRSTMLKGLLLLRGGPRVLVINTPWYLRDEDESPDVATSSPPMESLPESATAGSPSA